MDSIISTKSHKQFRLDNLSAVRGKEHMYDSLHSCTPLLLIDTAVVST